MQYLPLGNTGLTVTKPAMGCLPLQRCDTDYAVRLLQAAYEGGIRYFDTANAYTDSEKKIGLALADVRDDIVISTKSHGRDKATVLADIENSLKMMKTDYIDLFQFHQVPSVPDRLRGTRFRKRTEFIQRRYLKNDVVSEPDIIQHKVQRRDSGTYSFKCSHDVLPFISPATQKASFRNCSERTPLPLNYFTILMKAAILYILYI